MKKHYDILFVGAGLFNAVLAYRARKMGYSCLVIDKRETIGGNCATELRNGIMAHLYGAHIFHTSDKKIWDFVNQFAKFNNFINSPIAVSWDKQVYNLPFNMNTFAQLFGVKTPHEARERIKHEINQYKFANNIGDDWKPSNLEEQAIMMVGTTIYERLVKEYTEKQWNRKCTELPPEIITRLPLRFNYDNNYFNDTYQGIPREGYSQMCAEMFKGCDIELGVDFLKNTETTERYMKLADRVYFAGRVDEYYQYLYGALEYRSLRFEDKWVPADRGQGNAVVNYTGADVPYTRIIEHCWFDRERMDIREPVRWGTNETILTYEYPTDWVVGREPFYPIRNAANDMKYKQYMLYHDMYGNKKVEFVGRLGLYKYMDMDKVVAAALDWDIPKKPTIFGKIKNFLSAGEMTEV